MEYQAHFRDKNAAWFVYRRLQDESRHRNEDLEQRARIQDSTVFVPESKLCRLELIAEHIGAKYSILKAETQTS
jgi:hypothetical protein